ncbi:MAG: GxxExxY protein [Verrucomicrobiaceae bacterium]
MRFPDRKEDYPHAELSKKIIGAAIEVQKELKLGLDEKLYENALCIELARQGLHFEQQPEYPAHYKEHFIGKLRPDLVVEKTIIVETKIAASLTRAHDAQLLGYLAIAQLPLGLLINFNVLPLEVRRLLNPNRPS